MRPLVVDIIRVQRLKPPAARGLKPVSPHRPFRAFRKTARSVFTSFIAVALIAASLIGASAFEAHVVNVVATIDKRPCNTVASFEFDAYGNQILTGQRIDDEYAPWGLTIFVKQNSSIEPDPDHPSITFNSLNPTGDQFDLGTTNQDFSGPGVGDGGRLGAPGENNREQDHLLIAADNTTDENHNSLIDVPKAKDGDLGKVMFVFTQPTRVHSFRIVDVDNDTYNGRGTQVRLYDENRNNFFNYDVPALGDNSNQLVNLDAVMGGTIGTLVKAIKVRTPGSIGIDDFCFDRAGSLSKTDHLVVNEVYYDTDHRTHGASEEQEHIDEWIELYNPTNNPVNLKDWSVTDNSGTARTISTSNQTLLPGQFAILAKSASTFNFWEIPGSVLQIALGEIIGNGLANNGDRVILKDADGKIVDAMSYGADISQLNPSVIDVPEGHSVARQPTGFDTDQASDWKESLEPTPGTDYHVEPFTDDEDPWSEPDDYSSAIQDNSDIEIEERAAERIVPTASVIDVVGDDLNLVPPPESTVTDLVPVSETVTIPFSEPAPAPEASVSDSTVAPSSEVVIPDPSGGPILTPVPEPTPPAPEPSGEPAPAPAPESTPPPEAN